MTEFGRRAGENGSGGTDHGHGNCMFVMGGHVNGGQVLANWPGLAPGNLDNGDLAITIDYRDILAEILVRIGWPARASPRCSRATRSGARSTSRADPRRASVSPR